MVGVQRKTIQRVAGEAPQNQTDLDPTAHPIKLTVGELQVDLQAIQVAGGIPLTLDGRMRRKITPAGETPLNLPATGDPVDGDLSPNRKTPAGETRLPTYRTDRTARQRRLTAGELQVDHQTVQVAGEPPMNNLPIIAGEAPRKKHPLAGVTVAALAHQCRLLDGVILCLKKLLAHPELPFGPTLRASHLRVTSHQFTSLQVQLNVHAGHRKKSPL